MPPPMRRLSPSCAIARCWARRPADAAVDAAQCNYMVIFRRFSLASASARDTCVYAPITPFRRRIDALMGAFIIRLSCSDFGELPLAHSVRHAAPGQLGTGISRVAAADEQRARSTALIDPDARRFSPPGLRHG